MNTVLDNVLNVTVLEPRMKHPTIFARFDELKEGESLTIHNDHDPKPLYYQLLGERGNIFNWEYLENGPNEWKVKISKIVAGSNNETLGELVTKDFKKALIFKKYGLDFCCGGKKTVKEACAEKNLDVTIIEQELQQLDKNPKQNSLPYDKWSLDFLIDHIVNTHHLYVNTTIADMYYYAKKVMSVHGNAHPELLQIEQLTKSVKEELLEHMVKEEQILFPYIKSLVTSELTGQPVCHQSFGTVKNPIKMMETEHETVGESLAQIRKLTNNYSLPADACSSYNLLYKMLEDFEGDLQVHIHLENNILFPKAIALEKKLLN
jgi:regulator of cell morphogenesis and NO signaling